MKKLNQLPKHRPFLNLFYRALRSKVVTPAQVPEPDLSKDKNFDKSACTAKLQVAMHGQVGKMVLL
jgi:hypothetical protein